MPGAPQQTVAPSVVSRNRWRDVFDGEMPDGWQPTMSLSVVVAPGEPESVAVTLASLAAQDFPADLFEVVVVDDGREPPVQVGDLAPANVRVVRAEDGRDRGDAMAGIRASTGDIVYWVAAGTILARDNLREHAKWAHFIPEAATIAHVDHVQSRGVTPDPVHDEVLAGTIGARWAADAHESSWSEQIYRGTDDLSGVEGVPYAAHAGSCATMTRVVYERLAAAGTRIPGGDDTEISYQIWQAGGVFIPAHAARAARLATSAGRADSDAAIRYRQAYLAQRVPIPRHRRRADNRIWDVPLIRVVVELTAETATYARACVDRVLNSTETDVKVDLVGPWSRLDDERSTITSAPIHELDLVREWFGSDSRVAFVDEAPTSVFPSPFRLDLPVTVGLESDSLRQMHGYVDLNRVGVARFFTPGHSHAEAVTLWDSAALHRAAPYVTQDRALADVLDHIAGYEWVTNEISQLVDLRKQDREGHVTRTDPETTRLKQQVADLLQQLDARRPARAAERARKDV